MQVSKAEEKNVLEKKEKEAQILQKKACRLKLSM